jgi:uncharacterized protein YjiK
MGNNYRYPLFFFLFILFTAVSCESQQQPDLSPPGYNFNSPKKYRMPDILREISGIAFHNDNPDTLYAEEDENGRVYHFKLGDNQILQTRFSKKGDFEDIAICNLFVIMLRSDGVLFTFPLSETSLSEAVHVKEFKNLLPAGEYEGLACPDSSGKLFVLCKSCNDENMRKWGGGSILQIDGNGNLTSAGNFEINIKEIDVLEDSRKIKFHPSALARNQLTGEWYILSSTNKLLVVADQNWKVKSVYPLKPSLFAQPEGIAFDKQHNLYISNERGLTAAATILVFPYLHK